MARKWYIGGFKSAEVLSSKAHAKVSPKQTIHCPNVWRVGVCLKLDLSQSSTDVPPMLMERSVPCRRAGDIGTASTLPKLFY
jgi:hypothetical protein